MSRFRHFRLLALALPAPASALRPPNPKDSPPLEQELRAGLEELRERVAWVVAASEAWVKVSGPAAEGQAGLALVLDAVSLEMVPGLADRLGKSEVFGGRVVLWGTVPEGIEAPAVTHAQTPDDLSSWLSRQAAEGVAGVTFVGPESRWRQSWPRGWKRPGSLARAPRHPFDRCTF